MIIHNIAVIITDTDTAIIVINDNATMSNNYNTVIIIHNKVKITR